MCIPPLPSAAESFEDWLADGIFLPIIRCIGHRHDADDRIQEALCQTWELFERRRQAGRELGRREALFVFRRRLYSMRDRFVRRERHRGRDMLDERLRACRAGDERLTLAPAMEFAIEEAVDLRRFLAGLDPAERAHLELRLAGCSLDETAGATGVTRSSLHRRERALSRVACHVC